MVFRVLLIGTLFIAGQASAQITGRSPIIAGHGGSLWLGATGATQECLIDNRTGRRVCKDRAGWRKEAERIAREEKAEPGR